MESFQTNFDVASQLWDLRAWDRYALNIWMLYILIDSNSSLSYFERAFQLNSSCHASLSTSIYLRQYICKVEKLSNISVTSSELHHVCVWRLQWGNEGMLYQADLDTIEQLTSEELLMLEVSMQYREYDPILRTHM